LFGVKQHKAPVFDTLSLPTKEFINGQWIETTANWVIYPSLSDCFADRMATLQRLAPSYPHYAAALAAPDAQTFVTEVSKTWSTDPNRAAKVIAIFNSYIGQ
jgi:flagellum-specific peptidoglycan hydrolase FlgJ